MDTTLRKNADGKTPTNRNVPRRQTHRKSGAPRKSADYRTATPKEGPRTNATAAKNQFHNPWLGQETGHNNPLRDRR